MSIPNKVSAESALTHPHEFAGELAVKALPRLGPMMTGEQRSVTAKLTTDRDSGYPRLHGDVSGLLNLACQRCGKRFEWRLDAALDLRLVFSEHEERAALEHSDPFLVENDELPLRQIVEDEILLALPMLVRCKTCENALLKAELQKPASKNPGSGMVASNNPFAALKGKLKK